MLFITYIPLIVLLIPKLSYSGLLSEDQFRVIWNSPTQVCTKYLRHNIDLKSYGIFSNHDQAWRGPLINLFYFPTLGCWPYIANNNSFIHGGLPQYHEWEMHSKQLERSLNRFMNDKGFQGLAVIDYEEILPLWRDNQYGPYLKYVNASINAMREKNPTLCNFTIALMAQKAFETGFKNLFVRTLQKVIEERPQALWGFWGFPFCARFSETYFCDIANQRKNEAVKWLYDTSVALYPNVYLNRKSIPNIENRRSYILRWIIGDKHLLWPLVHSFCVMAAVSSTLLQIMNEAMRLSNLRRGGPVPIYPYARYQYESDVIPSFLSDMDLKNIVGQAIDTGMSGLIIWGDHSDFGNCSLLNTYVNMVLGPIVKKMSEYSQSCNDNVCNNHGRCVKNIFKSQPLYTNSVELLAVKTYEMFWLSDDWRSNNFSDYECFCFTGYSGSKCEERIPE